MAQENCGGCKFWVKDQSDPMAGWCHRNPPTLFVNFHADDVEGEASFWPSVGADEWCGEFRWGKSSVDAGRESKAEGQ